MRARLAAGLLMVAGLASAQDAGAGLDPELFPGIDEVDETTLRWHGLARLFPGRVIEEEPEWRTESARDEPARVEAIDDGIVYLRVYRLPEADALIAEHAASPALIIDLRYTRAAAGGAGLAAVGPHPGIEMVGEVPEALTDSLAGAGEAAARGAPAIILVNRRTAGPFEALLDGLQAAGSALLIGSPTAGATGSYRPVPEAPPFQVLAGEVRAEGRASLVGTGVKPRIEIATTAEEDYGSYFLFEGGSAIDSLIEEDDAVAEDDGGDARALDPVLRRAVEVIAALQVLERLPD